LFQSASWWFHEAVNFVGSFCCTRSHTLYMQLKEEFLMCVSLETTSEVTDDQEEMNNFYQQNKFVQLHWSLCTAGALMLHEVRFYKSRHPNEFLASKRVVLKFLEASLRPVVQEAGAKRVQAHPKSFDLVEIWEKSLKIRAKSVQIWAKCVKTFAKLFYVLWFYKNGARNESADVFLHFLEVMFFSLFGEVRGNLGKILCTPKYLPAPNLWCFFWGHFLLSFFRASLGKFGQNPSRPQKFACSYTYV